jgi:hypothetical protein
MVGCQHCQLHQLAQYKYWACSCERKDLMVNNTTYVGLGKARTTLVYLAAAEFD